MKLRLVKASQGLQWVRQGLLTLRKQPMGFMGLLGLSGMTALLLLALAGGAGPLVVVSVLPIAWAAFMVASRRVVIGQKVTLGVIAEVFQTPPAIRRDLLLLGAAYAVATAGVIALASVLGPDPEQIAQIMQSTEDMAVVLADPLVQQDMLLRMGLTLPLSLVFWHAPALIMWGRVPLAKAIFFSTVASWRNLGAFIMYGLGWLGLMLGFAIVTKLVSLLLPVPVLLDAVTMVGGMALASAFYASLYYSVIDCFDAGKAGEAPGPHAPPDQPEAQG